MSTTVNIDTYRAQLLQDISNVDNLEVLESIRRAYRRAMGKLKKEKEEETFRAYRRAMGKLKKEKEEETLKPYTLEELHARIDRALEDAKAGREYTNEEVFSMLENKYPWLCK